MNNAPTASPKKPIVRSTHRLNAADRTLGRLATEIAVLLRGKNKIGFTYHQDLGDEVIVENVEQVRLTGKKATQKMYYRHSQYPGGLTAIRFDQLQKTNPERIIHTAVRNMLPDNRLRAQWMKRLKLVKGSLTA